MSAETFSITILRYGNIHVFIISRRKVADEWGISEKVSCVVIDNASNIIAAAPITGWKNLPCMAHTLNLIVQESIEGIKDLALLLRKCCRIVTYFKQSFKAKDKLEEIQNK